MQKPALIFDLDGTLWDATIPVGEAWQEVGRKWGNPSFVFTADDAKSLMGLTMTDIAKRLCPVGLDPKDIPAFSRDCFDYEVLYLTKHPGQLFPKELETLFALKEQGYPLYIVSNCQKGYIETFLPLVPAGLFLDYMCFGDTGLSKDGTIRELMKRNGIESAIYVGDTAGDEKATRDAGLPFVFASYGFGQAKDPDAIAASFEELPKAISRIL